MKMTEVGYRGDMCVGADVHIPMGIVPGWVMIRLAGLQGYNSRVDMVIEGVAGEEDLILYEGILQGIVMCRGVAGCRDIIGYVIW